MRMDTAINCSSPRRNNQLNPNKYNMVMAKYTVMKLHNATHDTNMEKGPLEKKKERNGGLVRRFASDFK